MRLLVSIIFLLMSFSAIADEVKIEVNPPKPVAGEVFQAYFRIFTDSDEDPQINFSPGSLEVVGKANQGISTRTIYSNGRLSVTREITVVYDLVASKAGTSFMREITVQLGSKVLKHPAVAVTVLKEAAEDPEVFIMADVPKKEIFLGEGMVVRYYLYYKVQVGNTDVKKFPKLNNFLKRFLQDPDRGERVKVNGQVYLRNQIYAAKLFAEKIGELKIDPLQASIAYVSGRSADPFAAFGMSRDFKTKTISSDEVKVIVKPLPTPVPPHFTGLIGKHDFDLSFGTTKLIVNEPLEIKLAISGGGALENLEAPTILKHPGLEEFESNGDLKIASADLATKTFDYTFLARENMKLPASSITLSYFDPAAEKYVPVQLEIPALEVAGGSAAKESKEAKDEKPIRKDEQKFKLESNKVKDLAAPVLRGAQSYRRWLPYVNAGLGTIAILIALGWFVQRERLPQLAKMAAVPSSFKRGDFSLSEFARWLSPIIQKTGKSPRAIITESDLSEETKRYFIALLESNDYKNYSTRKSDLDFKYHAGHFKKLSRYIETAKNEDSSRAS